MEVCHSQSVKRLFSGANKTQTGFLPCLHTGVLFDIIEKMDRPPPGKVPDLATLAKLDEQILLNELKIRYYNNEIYVSLLTGVSHIFERLWSVILSMSFDLSIIFLRKMINS